MSKYEKDVRIIRRFLDFINFYRRFIPYFSKIARSLYNLLNKKSLELWTDVCIQTFRILQDTVSKELVMIYFDLDKQCFIECNSLDVVIKDVLLQLNEYDWLQFVTYFFVNLKLIERNYVIYDKKMFVIIHYFKEWRSELFSIIQNLLVQILTDHKILEYFMTTK